VRLSAIVLAAGEIRALALTALLLVAPLVGQVWATRAMARAHRIVCYVPELSVPATIQSKEAP
jgi:hypothetical protein